MHNAEHLVVHSASKRVFLFPLSGLNGVQLPLPPTAKVVAIQTYTENKTLLLCSVRGVATLFLYHKNSTCQFVWRGKGNPVRHGLAVGFNGVVWVTQGNAVVELCEWRPRKRYSCPAPGALSVNNRGHVVVACGADGLRDSLLEPHSGRPETVYPFLFDVVCVQCLTDGNVLVADCGADMKKNAIKLVGQRQVLRTIRVVNSMNRWLGISCAVDCFGQISLSDVKDRGVVWLYTAVAAGTSPRPRFSPTKSYLRNWPSFQTTVLSMILSINRVQPGLPLELVFYILAFL